jgi:general nucleoside transport system ATP-binding protein
MAYADDVTVLRKGRLVGTSAVADTDRDRLAAWMMGSEAVQRGATPVEPAGTEASAQPEAAPSETVREEIALAEATQSESMHAPRRATPADAPVRLALSALSVVDDRGHTAVREVSLQVRSGEILGIAGVSGNGQKELIEALVGQRRVQTGEMRVHGEPYRATREEMTRLRLFALPEEPLRNACVAGLSVAENLALRDFDRAPVKRGGWRIDRRAMRTRAEQLIAEFNVRPPLPERAIGTLSGGNVQRAVLARELGQPVDVLIVANPVFGLDFSSVADIHARLIAARDAGAAVLLVSEDLDELLELADRIAVMAEGRIVYETTAQRADRVSLGRHMAGHGDAHEGTNVASATVHA